MEAATIRIFLVHGTPKGLLTAELSNWSGKAIAAPRNELQALLKRPELASPGIYVLSGADPDTGDEVVYIGESEDVATRLKNHAGKDFWNAATVFVSKDENLTKAHIRYLEDKLILVAQENATSIVMNSASSGAKLPESDAAEMDVFLQKALQLLAVLGITSFDQSLESPVEEDSILYCKIKGLMAQGSRTSGGFTVHAGSQAVLDSRPSATRIGPKRDALIAKGILSSGDGHLVFAKDIEFSSPSLAAAIVRGGASNGLTAWKNRAGKTLKEIEKTE
jgi:hypothetical protein